MLVNFERSFLKDIEKLNDKKLIQKLKSTLLDLEEQTSLRSIQGVKKLRGYQGYYRIKVGEYRLGFFYKNKEIDVIRFMPRKDIYKFFP